MKNKQTAVDTLIEILVQECGFDNETETAQRVILLAKQMEEEQITDSYIEGHSIYGESTNAEQYYNETFGGQDESK